VSEKPTISTWKSEKAWQRYCAMEDELFHEQWPDPPDVLDLESFAGTTRLYHWPGEGDPIVLVPGTGGSSLSWTAYVRQLAGRDVWAIDTIGDIGRSVPTTPLGDAAGIARWIEETFAAAGIERAHLVGSSYGGFVSLATAIHAPARVASLTLIDPGGLTPIRLARFMIWGLPMLLGALAPGPIRRHMAKKRPLLEDPRLMKMTLHAQMSHVTRTPRADQLSDDELRSITAPTTVVIASHSAPFDPKISTARARLIPNASVDVIDAGHEVMWTHVERCASHVTTATSSS
jgi:pimeloyl-ACP methyl ester carboxylesterase